MTQSTLRFSRRLRISLLTLSVPCFAILAVAYAAIFQPRTEHALLSDALPKSQINNLSLIWQEAGENLSAPFSVDDKIAYGQLLRHFLLNEQQDSAFTAASEREALIHLRGRVRPELLLRNRSLATFQLSSDLLRIGLNESGQPDGNVQLRTERFNVRVATTRLGSVVRHFERLGAPAPLVKTERVGTISGKPLVGFNYYPASAPWHAFWVDYPYTEIKADFHRIEAMGGNSVRIFLTWAEFQDDDRRGLALQRLGEVLRLAEQNELTIILTCFDFGRGYGLSTLSDDWLHLERILEVADRANADVIIDLKNQPDLDFKVWGDFQVSAWLRALAELSRATYPELPLTIGWSNAEDAERLVDVVDVVSFHDYKPIQGLTERIAQLRRAADGKPVLLSEIGHTRWRINPLRGSQAVLYRQQLTHLEGLNGVLIWTLNDFDSVPSSVAGWQPWRKAMQARYGLDAHSQMLVAEFFQRFTSAPQPTFSSSIEGHR